MQFSLLDAYKSVAIVYRIYRKLLYVLPFLFVASLWLLNSQKRVFMNKLDEFINELEGVEKLAKKDQNNSVNNKGSEDDTGGLGLKEMVDEGEKDKCKLA